MLAFGSAANEKVAQTLNSNIYCNGLKQPEMHEKKSGRKMTLVCWSAAVNMQTVSV